MADRREEKERLRAERLAAQQSQAGSERRRLILGYVLAGILTLAVVAGLVAVIASGGDDGGSGGGGSACAEAHVQTDFGTTAGLEFDCREGTAPPPIEVGDLKLASREAGCTLMENLKDEGNSHVGNDKAVTYETNPPTSGDHNPNPAADGAFTTPLQDASSGDTNVRNFVHSLEHGRMVIQYSPDLTEDQQLAIKGIFEEDPGGILMFPNPNMPYQVAVTAWTNLVGCPTYSPRVLDVIRDFRDTHRGNGPENFPINA